MQSSKFIHDKMPLKKKRMNEGESGGQRIIFGILILFEGWEKMHTIPQGLGCSYIYINLIWGAYFRL